MNGKSGDMDRKQICIFQGFSRGPSRL